MALGNIIESFFVYLGFEIGDEELAAWTEKLHDVENITAAVGAACLLASTSVALLVHEVSEGIGELKEFAERNELNVEDLQAFGYAAEQSGSSLEAVKSSLQGMNQIIGEAALGVGRGAAIFRQLHLQAKNANGTTKTATELFTELSQKIKGMSIQEAMGMTRRLRIDPSLITLMRKGGDNLQYLTDEARRYGIVSEQGAEDSKNLMNSWKQLLFVLKASGQFIAVQLMPTFLRIQNSLKDWILKNKQLLAGGLIVFVKAANAVLGTLFDWVSRIVGVLFKVIEFMTQWKVVNYALLAVFGAIVTSGFLEMLSSVYGMVAKLVVKFWELDFASAGWGLLLGGVVLALGLLIDDIWNFYKGNDSLIGQLQGKYPHALLIAKGAIVALTAALAAMTASTIMAGVQSLIAAGTMIAAWTAALPETIAMAAAMLGIDWPIALIAAGILLLIFLGYELWKHWKPISAWFKKVWEDIAEGVMVVVDKIEAAAKAVKAFFQGIPDHLRATLHLGNDPLPASSGPGGRTSGVLGRPAGILGNQTVYHTPISVGGITVVSPDPDRAGSSVQNKLRELHGNTIRDGQTGVGL